MITPDNIKTYAQYHEDIILAGLLDKKENGFYVDVGANHEEYHSVTKYFYEKGWRGINIEPIPRLIKEFNKKRPHDINLNIAISTEKGTLQFREDPEHDGLSAVLEDGKTPQQVDLPHKDYKVHVDTLANVFSKYKVKNIDFLKIDVEGLEYQVLKSNDWKKYRPTVVCIEANHRESDWSEFLLQQKYIRVINDGLNEYYVAEESVDIFTGFAERTAILAHNALRSHQFYAWGQDVKHIDDMHKIIERQDKLIKNIDNQLQSIEFLVRRLARTAAKKVLKLLKLR